MRRDFKKEHETLLARMDALQAVWAMTGKNELAHDYTAALYANQASALCKWGVDIDLSKEHAGRWREYLKMWLANQSELKAHDATYVRGVAPEWHAERLRVVESCERVAWRLWQAERLLGLRDDAFVNALGQLANLRAA